MYVCMYVYIYIYICIYNMVPPFLPVPRLCPVQDSRLVPEMCLCLLVVASLWQQAIVYNDSAFGDGNLLRVTYGFCSGAFSKLVEIVPRLPSHGFC